MRRSPLIRAGADRATGVRSYKRPNGEGGNDVQQALDAAVASGKIAGAVAMIGNRAGTLDEAAKRSARSGERHRDDA